MELFCVSEVSFQSLELVGSACEYLYFVVDGEFGLRKRVGEDYELSSVGRYAGFVEVHVTGGGGAHQLALFVPGHHPDAFQAAAEEEIETRVRPRGGKSGL